MPWKNGTWVNGVGSPKWRWTPERTELLRQWWAMGLSATEIGTKIGCTKNAVIGKVNRLKLKQGDRWTPERICKLREMWERGVTGIGIAETLREVTSYAVIAKARHLKLKRPWENNDKDEPLLPSKPPVIWKPNGGCVECGATVQPGWPTCATCQRRVLEARAAG